MSDLRLLRDRSRSCSKTPQTPPSEQKSRRLLLSHLMKHRLKIDEDLYPLVLIKKQTQNKLVSITGCWFYLLQVVLSDL